MGFYSGNWGKWEESNCELEGTLKKYPIELNFNFKKYSCIFKIEGFRLVCDAYGYYTPEDETTPEGSSIDKIKNIKDDFDIWGKYSVDNGKTWEEFNTEDGYSEELYSMLLEYYFEDKDNLDFLKKEFASAIINNDTDSLEMIS